MPRACSVQDPIRSEDELVRAHLPLVQYAVAEMVGRVPRHVSRDDLVSAAMAGLAQAARSFDHSRGISFSSFASLRIKGAIIDELRSRDWASRSVRAKARTVSSTTDRLTSELGRTPTSAELAEAAGMGVGELSRLSADVTRAAVLHLDGLRADGSVEEVAAFDDLGPDEVLEERERRAYLVAAVAELPDRLRRVVVGSFLDEVPMAMLAREFGVSESRISQMRTQALEALRGALNATWELAPAAPDVPDTACVSRRKASYHQAVRNRHGAMGRLAAGAACLSSLVAVPA